MTVQSSQRLTLDINSMVNVGDDHTQIDPVTWLNSGPGTYTPLFRLVQPLDVVDVIENESPEQLSTRESSSLSVVFAPGGELTVQGAIPDVYIRNAFRATGTLITSVDTLSRSVNLIDCDAATVVNAAQKQADIPTDTLTALDWTPELLRFDDLPEEATAQARAILMDNVRQHERKHVTTSLNPPTALWKELELQWCWMILSGSTDARGNENALHRFAALYGTPSSYTSELLAIVQEDRTAENAAVQRAVEQRVSTHQGGAVRSLIKFLRCHDIDYTTLIDILRLPIGEKYCDLWLAYVINQLRHGGSLSEIDVNDFLRTCDVPVSAYDGRNIDSKTRSEHIAFFDAVCMGPVVEVIRLTKSNGNIVLEQTWVSMASDASDAESLLAVRRALFRRQFLSAVRRTTRLDVVLADRTAAVERVIRGASLENVSLSSNRTISTGTLTKSVSEAYETAIERLLGSHATRTTLSDWLNDPAYGYDS